MDNQLKRIIIHGAVYSVDYENERFIRVDGIDTFYFKDIEKPSYGGMESWYNYITGKLGELDMKDPYNSRRVRFPEILFTRKDLDNKEYAKEFNLESDERQWGILLFDSKIQDRINGKLPIVTIAGDIYDVNWEQKELISRNNKEQVLKLDENDLNRDTGNYELFYHTRTQKAIPIGDIRDAAREVVYVELPYRLLRDPVSAARERHLPDVTYLTQWSIIDSWTADHKKLAAKDLPPGIKGKLEKMRILPEVGLKQKIRRSGRYRL